MEKKLFVLLVAAVSPLLAIAQNIITGRVVEKGINEPLIGATVLVKNEKGKGVVTDIDGNFSLPTKQEAPLTILVQFVGYRSQEIDVYDFEEPVEIQLVDNSSRLDEIVVVGYGTQKRTQLTGSVTTVKADIFEKISVPTLDGALSGQVAGLNVTASSGQPGADSQIRIRGGNSVNASNEPLYVIDGFIYFKDAANATTGIGGLGSSLNPLSTVNPNDIESIEVLKDVSATAIYGSRGANGVIIVTTKKGKKAAESSSINYSYGLGVSTVSKKLDLLNASEWAQFQKTYFSNKGGYTDAEIAALGEGTDWQDAVLRTAVQQTHELSVSGGSEKSRYAFSANYTDQDGIVLNTNFQRYNFHTNVDWELRKNFNFGINATFGRSRQDVLTTLDGLQSASSTSPFSAGITNSFVYALLMPPVISVYNADGSYNFKNPYEYAYFAIGDHMANPVYDLEESVAENINNYLLSNVWTTYKVGPVTLKATVGLSSEKLTQNLFAGAYTSLGMATEGIGGTGNRQTDIWQQEYTATFDKDLNASNHLDALVGYTYQHSESTYSLIMTNHFTNESLKQYNLGDGANIYTPETGISESRLHSIIGRLNYSLLDRYNLTATFRADRSSRFSSGHKWGQFPSLGLSWNVDKESFFANVQRIDYLKVRASVGLVGNQEIPDAAYLGTYNTGSYGGSSSYSASNASNDNLKWESTLNYNVGFDLGLLHNRVNIVADAYYKKTYDLLFVVPLGISSTVSKQLQNVGNVVNKGFELSIDGSIIKRRRVQWTAAANIAHNSNELTDMGSSKDLIYGSDNQQILSKGEPVGAFYGLEFDGIVQSNEDVTQLPKVNGNVPSPGDVKYVDHNGDGKIDGYDRTFLGSTQPKLTYGLSTQFTWRNFDVSVAFAGSVGNRVYNALGRRLEQTGDSYNVLSTVLGSWTAENGGNRLPLASTTRPFSHIDSRYVQDASYLKLRNVSVGYRVPLPKDGFIRGLKVSISAANVLTFTNYKGYDPEVASGTDDGVYPASRSVSFGVNVSL
ncbi:MAG: TonB-dependent receptor [Bacteroidales bacterium]|nr:TonB-dependent receptor [Bacteroidales bacterium]